MAGSDNALFGVIEGFYGQPWSQGERAELLRTMENCGLNSYLYAPKDDLKHRLRWREIYGVEEAATLRELIAACGNIRFFYALGPGLDINYSNPADLNAIKARFQQVISLGAENFALLFDDIPDAMQKADLEKFGSFAAAQAYVTNEIFRWLRAQLPSARLLFCPTPYCGRMAQRQLGGADYLETIGREFLPEIEIFWTGPEIISPEISVAHVREIASLLRRKPLLWDNLHANDYDGRRFYAGPYSGRPRELIDEVSGILTNPNNEFALNFIPLRTFADYLSNTNYNPRESHLSALRDWLPQFNNMTFEDLTLLCDCFYLPHENGPEASRLLESLASATSPPSELSRLRQTCARIAEIENRPLFYALSRRVWELREELDLLEKFLAHNDGSPFQSDFHLPKTYRGGFVPALQKLLRQNPDGSFTRT